MEMEMDIAYCVRCKCTVQLGDMAFDVENGEVCCVSCYPFYEMDRIKQEE